MFLGLQTALVSLSTSQVSARRSNLGATCCAGETRALALKRNGGQKVVLPYSCGGGCG